MALQMTVRFNVVSNPDVDANILLKGDIHWGFLKLDEDAVDIHPDELKSDVSARKGSQLAPSLEQSPFPALQ